MSKQIRLTDETYRQLQALQEPRETMSQLVDRLILIYERVKEATLVRRRDSKEMPHVPPG